MHFNQFVGTKNITHKKKFFKTIFKTKLNETKKKNNIDAAKSRSVKTTTAAPAANDHSFKLMPDDAGKGVVYIHKYSYKKHTEK